MATLIVLLFSLGGMARRNELIAMTASGVSLYRILVPVFAAGALITAAAPNSRTTSNSVLKSFEVQTMTPIGLV